MDDNIFSQKKERELQILRQRSASNVVKVDPNLKGFLDRFNPDVSRATLLRAQRARAPTKEELEKSVGVKTAKKLKKRRGKNLRGEVARNLREQRRFERGERRDRPEQEPRIVGDPVPPLPQVPGAPAQPQADPNAQLRLAIEGRRIAAQDAQQRRLVDLLADRDDRERRERQAILDRGLAERGAILDIGIRDRDASRAERDALLDRGEAERLQLRQAFRELLEGEAAFQRQERQDILDQAQEERTALDRQARIERERILTERGAEVQELAQIRERVAEQASAERAQDRKEREELLGQLVNLTTEERREREAREERQAQQQIDERQRQQQERETIDTQAAEEREGILRLTLDQDINPREGGGTAQADRDFLQRQFQQGLETIERRIGESEARTQEQIRQHADRVAAIERQPPIVVQQPAQQPAAAPQATGPTAAEIAASVRRELESPRTRERRTTRRRIDIEEQTTDTEDEDFSPTASARRRQIEGRGAESPQPEIGFEAGEEEVGFSPVQSPRTQRTPQSTGRDPPVFVSEAEARGAPEPEVAPPSPRRSPRVRPPTGPPVVSRGTQTGAIPASDPEKLRRDFAETGGISAVRVGTGVSGVGGVVAEPSQRPSERIPELEGSQGSSLGVLVDPANLPQEGFGEEGVGGGSPRRDLFSSGQFAGDIMAAGQNAIGYVGGIAGDANQRLGELFRGGAEAVVPGEQQGGGLRDPQGNPIFGLGQEIEPAAPTIQPLQSDQPARRVAPPTGPPPQLQEAAGLVEEEEEAEARAIAVPSQRNNNFRLYESLRDEIDANYTRGRATGGARGALPFQIVNTTDRMFKKLKPGQAVSLAQVERNGTLGYYPLGQGVGTKAGITRISRSELEKQIKAGKLKIDRNR